MSTKIRSNISQKNPYYISENRYRELKYFCLQYPEWRDVLTYGVNYGGSIVQYESKTGDVSRPVEDTVIFRDQCSKKMQLVEWVARECDSELWLYLLKAVTEGKTYEYFQTAMRIPCGRRQFYEKYRRFFWLLDRILQGL